MEFEIFWDTLLSQNRHVLVTGKSGSGKTTALLHLAQELQKSSSSVYFLDYTGGVPMHGPLHTQDILQHPYIRDTFSQHSMEQNAVENLLRYTDITANIWKLGVQQKSMITNALLRMNCLTSKRLDNKNLYVEYVMSENGNILRNINALAYCLASFNSKQYFALANRFLDYVLITNNGVSLQPPLLEQTSATLTVFKFPKVGQALNSQLTDIFLWSLFLKYKDTEKLKPVTIICDEARLLNWSKAGIVSKILNEGRKSNINLILATQSLTDEIPKSALPSIFQADLHLAFAPPVTDQKIIAKSLFDRSSAADTEKLSSLPAGHCFARGYLCSDKTPTFPQTLRVKIPLPEDEI